MMDRDGVLAMAPEVAATRLKKFHFINWLNWNCESLVRPRRPSATHADECVNLLADPAADD